MSTACVVETGMDGRPRFKTLTGEPLTGLSLKAAQERYDAERARLTGAAPSRPTQAPAPAAKASTPWSRATDAQRAGFKTWLAVVDSEMDRLGISKSPDSQQEFDAAWSRCETSLAMRGIRPKAI